MELLPQKSPSKRRRKVALILAAAVASLSLSILTTSKMNGLVFAIPYYYNYLYESHNEETSGSNATLHNNTIPANRTLVIVMGELRAGEVAWRTLYQNVLDPNSADLALLTTNNLTLYPNNTLMKRAKYVWYYENFDDWANAIDLVGNKQWRTTHLPEFHDYNKYAYRGRNRSILFGGIRGHDGSGIIIFMMRFFLMQHIIASGILDLYDSFVVTRTDHYYLCPHLITTCNLRDNTIWVPEGEEYGGYTDRHLVVGKDNLLDALDIIRPLITKPYEFDYDKHHNTERFVKYVWADKNLTVKKCMRSMFTVATEYDTTRWAAADEELPDVPGLFVKYRREYLRAKSGCMQFYHNSNHTIIRGATQFILQDENQLHNKNIEKMTGPLLFGWNGTTFEEGMLFCQDRAGSRSICSHRAYCRGGIPFAGIQRNDNEELWSPVGLQGQPVWVAVGSVNACIQKGKIDEMDKTNVKFILCCHDGEEEQAETMPDVAVKPELCAAPG